MPQNRLSSITLSIATACLALGWWILVSIGAIGLVLISFAALFMLASGPRNIGVARWVFAGLCGLYFSYAAIGGVFSPPLNELGDSLSRIAPIFLAALLVLSWQTSDNTKISHMAEEWLWPGTTLATIALCGITAYGALELGSSRPRTLHGNTLLASNALFVGAMIPFCSWGKARLLYRLALITTFFLVMITLVAGLQARTHAIFIVTLGGPVSLWFTLQWIQGPRQWFWRIIVLVTVLALGCACLFWFLNVWDHPIAERLKNGLVQVANSIRSDVSQESDKSFSLRQIMWHAGIEAFKEAPIFGHGIQHRFDAIDTTGLRLRYSHLHNSLITHMVSGGLVGVALYLSILLFPLWFWTWSRLNWPEYWASMPTRKRQELFWLGGLGSLLPLTSGLTNVVFFESTLIFLALFPLAFWVTRLPARHSTISN